MYIMHTRNMYTIHIRQSVGNGWKDRFQTKIIFFSLCSVKMEIFVGCDKDVTYMYV